jgi:hypothetical protein
LIYDLAACPEAPRQGIGWRRSGDLLAWLPVWRVTLVAGEQVQDFYRRFGFEIYPDAMTRVDRHRLCDAPAAVGDAFE